MKNKRIGMAALVTVAGLLLCYLDFFINGVVSASSLGFLGECLMWSGSVYGAKAYIDYKLNNYSDNHQN